MNIQAMWNHQDPAGSESRFREALEHASGDTALILRTQIARTHGVRKRFDEARAILRELQPQLEGASAEAQAYFWLEWGRTFCSATHPPESQTDDAHAEARAAFTRAFETARDAKLDRLAVDELHMMAFVDTAPEQQLDWNLKTLAYMDASSDPDAKTWEASLRHNVGYGLHGVGRLPEALEQFELALKLRERQGDAQAIRVAHWMIAWTQRGLGRVDEALEIQLRLERECDAAGEPDPYVFEELAALHEATGNPERAAHYRAKRAAL